MVKERLALLFVIATVPTVTSSVVVTGSPVRGYIHQQDRGIINRCDAFYHFL